MSKQAKWKDEYMARIKAMTNREALEEYKYMSGGDDYDGCYTKPGEWKWEQIEKEFLARLYAYSESEPKYRFNVGDTVTTVGTLFECRGFISSCGWGLYDILHRAPHIKKYL